MENASKALIIAAGILIGVVILSIMVYLFVSYQKIADTYDEQIEERISKDKIAEIYNEIVKKKYSGQNFTLAEVVNYIQYQNKYGDTRNRSLLITVATPTYSRPSRKWINDTRSWGTMELSDFITEYKEEDIVRITCTNAVDSGVIYSITFELIK